MTNTDLNLIREDAGKFGHSFERICRCGRAKGEHTAARPFTAEGGGKEICHGFKVARKK